jgi:hypothetical protein
MNRMRLALACAGLAVLLAAAPAAASSPFHVIATGLLNPRGLSLGPNGRLYVAEAGVGAGSDVEGLGPTGKIIAIVHPGKADPWIHTVRTGITSLGSRVGTDTEGVDGISVDANGIIWAIVGRSAKVTGISDPQIGRLLRIRQNGTYTTAGNVGDRGYYFTKYHPGLDPGGQFPDANPYGVFAGGHRYVVDAGANTLDVVKPDGTVRVLAYFPNTPAADAIPTCVARGPDGALYIGTLALVDSLFAGPPHPAATVYRVDPSQTNPNNFHTVLNIATVWATGFWPIHGCTFGPDGSFWVSQIFTKVGPRGPGGGEVVRVPWNHPNDQSLRTKYGAGQLDGAGGIAVADDGTVYVANRTTSADGEVLRFRP